MTRVGGIAQDQLRSIVERIERLEEEKKALSDDVREVYAEAKANGFDCKTLRQVIKLRKMDSAERQEAEALLDLYLHALGMLSDTPLGEAAIERAQEDAREQRNKRPSRRKKSALDKAVAGLGTPVPLTDEEKAKGAIAAFDNGGTRMSIAIPGARPHSPAAEFASDLAGGASE